MQEPHAHRVGQSLDSGRLPRMLQQPIDGALAEYAVVKADVQYRVPGYMSF